MHLFWKRLSLKPAKSIKQDDIGNLRKFTAETRLKTQNTLTQMAGGNATTANGLANGHTNGHTNGVNGTNGHKPLQRSQPTKVFQSLSQCLPPRDPDVDRWWQITGQHLAAMCEAAGYSIEKQYEVLLMHHQFTVRCYTHVSVARV